MEIENIFDANVWQQINTAKQCLEAAMAAANALKHRELAKDVASLLVEVSLLQIKCENLSRGK